MSTVRTLVAVTHSNSVPARSMKPTATSQGRPFFLLGTCLEKLLTLNKCIWLGREIESAFAHWSSTWPHLCHTHACS